MDDRGLRLGGIGLVVLAVVLPAGQALTPGSTSGWWPATAVVSGVYALVCGALCVVVVARPDEQRPALVPLLKAWSYGGVAATAVFVAAMLLAPKDLPWLSVLALIAALGSVVLVTLAMFRITAEPQEA